MPRLKELKSGCLATITIYCKRDCVKKEAQADAQEPLKAGELARRTGLTRQALHIYVQVGLLHPVSSSKGGHRYYAASAVERIQLIRKLIDSGYTLKDIRDIFLKDR